MFQRASFPLYCVLVMFGCSEDAPPGPPLAPVNLTARGTSSTVIELSWRDMSDDELGFTIYRSSLAQFVEMGKVAANVSTFIDEGLAPGTGYSYIVSSFNSNGSSPSQIATGTTLKQTNSTPVTTAVIGKAGMASALATGSTTEENYRGVTIVGHVWSTVPTPTIQLETKSVIHTDNKQWHSIVGALQLATQYHVRAYVTNDQGTVYGNEVTFTTSNEPFFKPGGGVVDIEGNIYKTIIIGDQEWMAENLRTMTYSNGEKITNVTDGEQWSQLTTPAWCHFDNNTQYDELQGKMYNWYAVSNPRNVCPTGWHVPTLSEWSQLNDFLGGGDIAGVRLKSPIPSWTQPDLSTNESGFSALHSGICHPCESLNSRAYWWSSTKVQPYEGQRSPEAFIFEVSAGSGSSAAFFLPVGVALCVRCMKN